MITIEQYNPDRQSEWNQLVELAPNGLFIFDRNYMDYHADRFADHSLMFIENGKLIALLPANIDDEGNLVTHGGLTFGSLIRTRKLRTRNTLELFETLIEYSRSQSFRSIIYKPIPVAFQEHPAEDDLYAMHRCGFTLMRRDLSSIIPLNATIKYSKGRKWSIGKAIKQEVSVRTETQIDSFYDILANRLETKHSQKPTHSKDELALLSSRFPNNITVSCAYLKHATTPCAGVTLYNYERTLHTQYMATTDIGQEIGALDFLIDHHINEAKRLGKSFFSFGISTEKQGTSLNLGLLQQKESFGAQATLHDLYELKL